MSKNQTITKNQEGMASLVIVILIMTLLSLIVLSMTKNANREQEQSLERQLNSQAFYAAESGINDARDYYTQNVNAASNPAPDTKSDCSGISGATAGNQFPGYSSNVGNGTTNTTASYSCVLYDAHPSSLIFSDIGPDTSVLMPLQEQSGAPLEKLTFTWKKPNDTNYDFAGCPASGFPRNLNSCDAAVLRVELIDPSDLTRSALINNDFIAYLSPSPSGGAVTVNYNNAVGTANQGVNWRGGCTGGSDGKCSITINNVNRNILMMHLRSFYDNNQVEVSGITTDPITHVHRAVQFVNGQMMIDATGRASDVLKRVEVRVPLNQYGNGFYPEFALETSSRVCKLLQIVPSSVDGDTSSSDCPIAP
ncbi:MAG TPA: pilus assembly PilX N-terminal domain-containing protein [Candidatus Saccharimonadales bacterium]|nr:pilus assembly PilX N-terminal domain-containing protein [Candidatus Saccharimonadales bacterium]